ncbi:MAG: RNA polymerase subunit sigma-70 [Mesorhizobium amorphae]|nr:MAG: RNA polymerase subunit sigma-70 [Mesorhizobium amorphae]
MATLKEFEEELRAQGMRQALAILERLKARDKAKRKVTPARRVVGRKMTPDLARHILELHESTKMTQQEIAFKLGVNQGRVNEVIKRGKWLTDDPAAPEVKTRDEAVRRIRAEPKKPPSPPRRRAPKQPPQLTFGEF